ncbi:MAG: hypothetical protein RBU37_26765, partial [Myxococcota bacterium]|nr:hypothetical protein [Myxococcota bacterium]
MTSFAETTRALQQWQLQRDATAWPVFRALCTDLAAPELASHWSGAVGDNLAERFTQVDAQLTPALELLAPLSWFAEAKVDVHYLGRSSSGMGVPNPALGTNYDLLWLDISHPSAQRLLLPEATLRRFHEACVRALAGESIGYARLLRRSLVVLATLHGSQFRLPDLLVAGPARDSDANGTGQTLVGVVDIGLNQELRRGETLAAVLGRLAALAPLAAGSDCWQGLFGVAHRDVRTAYRNATRAVLEQLMALLERAAGVNAADDELGALREAASLVFFRVLFLTEVNRRGLLYLDPDGPSLDERVAAALSGEADGSLAEELRRLTLDVRGELSPRRVALRGASIFATPPNAEFDPGIARWLGPIEASTPADLKRELDRALAHAAAVASGQIGDQTARSAASAVGFGGAEHAHRVLGDVYEQILAMRPTREHGKPCLRVAVRAAGEAAERAALGAHYTPEQLVEAVVRPALGALFRHCWRQADGDLAVYREAVARLRVVDPAMGSAHFLTVAALELARELAWVDILGQARDFAHHEPVEHPDPEEGLPDDELLRQRFRARVRELLPELVRTACYGVDINPLAVELGKLALWLFTLTVQQAVRPELTFLDGNIRCGDSLVGVSWEEAVAILEKRLGVSLEATREMHAGSGANARDLRSAVALVHATLRLPQAELLSWAQVQSALPGPADSLPTDVHALRAKLLAD